MKTNILIGLCFVFILTSCKGLHSNDCYLGFELGMFEYEYENILKDYIKSGELKKQFTKSTSDDTDKEEVLTTIFKSYQGVLEPIFLSDRLDQLIIFIGEDFDYKSRKATVGQYLNIVNNFKEEFGAPTEDSIDPKSQHMSTTWQTDFNYSVEVAYQPENDLSKNTIGIYFKPTDKLEEELEKYNTERKNQ